MKRITLSLKKYAQNFTYLCFLSFLFFASIPCFSQVGINTTTPNAQLEIQSTNQATPSNTDGILIPKIDEFPLTNPTVSQDGMMVFVTGSGTPAKGFYYWNNPTSTWILFNGNGAEKIDDLTDGKSDNDGSQDGSSVFLGVNAGLNDDSSENQNIGLGYQSLMTNTTGNGNTALGYRSLENLTNSNGNVAIGSSSLISLTTGNFNTVVGADAMHSNQDGNYNSGVGSAALYHNTDGRGNIAMGTAASGDNTTGDYNVALGFQTLRTNLTGSHNVAVGYLAGYNETGSNRLYIENSDADANNALIYGQFDTNILRTNSQFQIGNPTGTGFSFPTVDGTANQVLQTDGNGAMSWVDGTVLGSNDADWFEEGTTTAPNDINDDIYTQGNVAIGKTIAYYALDIENDGTRGINTVMNGTNDSDIYGHYIQNSNSGTGIHYGSYNILNGTGDGQQYGMYNDIENSGNNTHYGIYNNIDGDGAGFHAGVHSLIGGSGNGQQRGMSNLIINSGSGNHYGTLNSLAGDGSGIQYGTYQQILGDGDGIHYGVHNLINNNGNGTHYGVYNDIQGNGTNTHSGTYNRLNGTGSGDKYGSRNYIDNSAGGTHYGVYSSVAKTGSFAGYFLGNVSVGTTTSNNYILPASRGTNNQIMKTDGSGNVTWVDGPNFTSASNGLTINANDVVLGGTLTQATTLTQGTNNLAFNLNNSGDFIVQDAGVDVFEVRSNGSSYFGSDTYWKDVDTGGTNIGAFIDDGDDGRFLIYENGTLSVDLDANTGFVFNEQGLDRDFRIESDGETNLFRVDAGNNRIGIMDSSPNFDIQLKQSSNTEAGAGGMGFESSASTNNWKIYHSGTHFSFAENGTRRAYIEGGTGNYVQPSDERLKRDFILQNNYLSKVKNINIYSYLYKSQTNNKRNIGVKAQELEQLFPELISEGEDGYLGMNYAGLGVIAIQAIKEQQKEIELLKKENEALKEKQKSLEGRLQKIEQLVRNKN